MGPTASDCRRRGVPLHAVGYHRASDDAGYALDSGLITMTSDANGLAQYTGFVRGAKYQFRRGKNAFTAAAVTAPEATTWSLTELLGTP